MSETGIYTPTEEAVHPAPLSADALTPPQPADADTPLHSRLAELGRNAYGGARRIMATAGVIVAASSLAPGAALADRNPHESGTFAEGPVATAANYDPNHGQEHSNALGRRTIAAILVNFNDDHRKPFTAEQVREAMFTGADSVSSYFTSASFGQIHFNGKYSPEGDVYDWVRLPSVLRNSCEEQNFRKLGRLANRAVESTTGADLDGYDNYMYIFPRRSNCINGNNGHVLNGEALGNSVFINSRHNTTGKGVYTHELGHNYGLAHASLMRCRNTAGRLVLYTMSHLLHDSCNFHAYLDPMDPMGIAARSIGTPLDFDGLNKARMGWLKPADFRTIDRNKTIKIAPVEVESERPQLVRVPTMYYWNEWHYLYLDFRQPLGVDADMQPKDPMFNGVTIRDAGPIGRGRPRNLGEYSYLVDTHPETPDAHDAPLKAGETYRDVMDGITITTLDTDPSGATVRIRVTR